MIKAILFDFNGILINDEPLQMQAYKSVLKQENIEITDEDYYAALGMDDVSFVRAIYDQVNLPLTDEVLQRILSGKMKAHREMLGDEVPVFGGAVNFVKQARHHFALGVVSMARNDMIVEVLGRLKILDAFSVIVSAEEVKHHKPDPECYNLGFRELDQLETAKGAFPLVREEVLVIEDAPPGVRAAKAAGMWVLGVTNTVAADELRNAGADSVTKTLADWTSETVELVFR